MAYTTQGDRVIKVARRITPAMLVREHLKKFGVTPEYLLSRMKIDAALAERVYGVLSAVQSPDFQHRNPNHDRVHRRSGTGSSARQFRKERKAFNLAMKGGRLYEPDLPFDSIELSDEGRVCFGGRC